MRQGFAPCNAAQVPNLLGRDDVYALARLPIPPRTSFKARIAALLCFTLRCVSLPICLFVLDRRGSKLDGETGSPFSALEAGGHFLRHSEAVRDGVSVCGGSTKLPSDSLKARNPSIRLRRSFIRQVEYCASGRLEPLPDGDQHNVLPIAPSSYSEELAARTVSQLSTNHIPHYGDDKSSVVAPRGPGSARTPSLSGEKMLSTQYQENPLQEALILMRKRARDSEY